MQKLQRKPDLSVRREMSMSDGVKIEVVGITARQYMEIFNKKMSDHERAMHITAAKMRVDGQPVVYDDLLDCFSSEELETIVEFVNSPKEEGEKNE